MQINQTSCFQLITKVNYNSVENNVYRYQISLNTFSLRYHKLEIDFFSMLVKTDTTQNLLTRAPLAFCQDSVAGKCYL